jgi:hypothetical protein
MRFCDYCPCDDCLAGTEYISHAQTVDGKWICDVCFEYEVCLDKGSTDPCAGICGEHKCDHRPTIVSEWQKANV